MTKPTKEQLQEYEKNLMIQGYQMIEQIEALRAQLKSNNEMLHKVRLQLKEANEVEGLPTPDDVKRQIEKGEISLDRIPKPG